MDIEIREKIIEYINSNKVSTTEVADCLGKKGALKGVKPVNLRMFEVGAVKWVYAYNNSNWDVHEQVVNTKKGDIVFIEAFDCDDRAIIGELVTKYIVLYKGAKAIICNTNFRDGNDLIKQNYPVWCTGFNPVGCFNTKNEKDLDEEIINSHRKKYEGAVAVCDDTGVVIIEKENLTLDFYNKLVAIEEQEDIWFHCLDYKKWNTYDIVCLKKYKDSE